MNLSPRRPDGADDERRSDASEDVLPASYDTFEAFYRQEFKNVIRYLRWQGADQQTAEEAASETMILIYLKWDTIARPASFARVVAYRMFLRSRTAERERWRRFADIADISDAVFHEPLAVDHVEQQAVVSEVVDAIRTLPPAQRAVAALCLVEGMTVTAAANELGINPSTARTHLARARQRLRPLVADTDDLGALVDALIAVPAFHSPGTRDEVISMLRPEIGATVDRFPRARAEAVSLVKTCRRFRGGLAELVEAVRVCVGDVPEVEALAVAVAGSKVDSPFT